MDTSKYILLGLPGSGKTTFLAAFWYLIENNLDTNLTVDLLHGEREYLNSIRDKWLSCDTVDRTRTTNEQEVYIKLINKTDGSRSEIAIPDLSGETYRDQWINRGWTKEFELTINDVDGVLLFIHPNELQEATRIDQAESLIEELETEGEMKTENNFPPEIEWDPKDSPTQVQLVELLQFYVQSHKSAGVIKIAVIISAWDLVTTLNISPEKWLLQRLPLLNQYLLANSSSFQYKVYGVSAQGGDYEEEQDKLLGIKEPKDRIKLVCKNLSSYDITIPLIWLMNNNG